MHKHKSVYNNFQSTLIEKYNIGSGIIPISIDETGNMYILLAKEKYSPSWKGSNRWSGFEGGKKNLEIILESKRKIQLDIRVITNT